MAKSDMSIREAHGLAGELARQTKLYLKLEEVLGIALQAEDDQKATLKEIDQLKIDRDKIKAEYEEYSVKVKGETRKVEAELSDVKKVGEVQRKQRLESSDKDQKFLSDKIRALHREIEGLVKECDGISAELPNAKQTIDSEINEYRNKAHREKKNIDEELVLSQNKLHTFKTNIAGLPG